MIFIPTPRTHRDTNTRKTKEHSSIAASHGNGVRLPTVQGHELRPCGQLMSTLEADFILFAASSHTQMCKSCMRAHAGSHCFVFEHALCCSTLAQKMLCVDSLDLAVVKTSR